MRSAYQVGTIAIAVTLMLTESLAGQPRDVEDRPPVSDVGQLALEEGNSLFQEGRLEAAVSAYLEGYSPQTPHPTLFYNLGTALHHLGRLPEAILWYRRAAGPIQPGHAVGANGKAAFRNARDPWLEENLWLARRSLGSQILQPAGISGWLVRHVDGMRWVAIAGAWITLLWVLLNGGSTHRAMIAAGSLTLSLYGGAAAIENLGPRPAVILQDCTTAAAKLPAGTEVWVRPETSGWRISGTAHVTCPPEAIALITPP